MRSFSFFLLFGIILPSLFPDSLVNILIVEDDPILSRSLVKIVQRIPLVNVVDTAHDFKTAYNKSMSDAFDVILADIDLQDEFTGLDLCAAIRKKNTTIILIIVTAFHSTKFLASAFEKGVNDYITKPFRKKELQLRVKRWASLLGNVSVEKSIHYHELSYSPGQNEFFFSGKMIDITKREKYLLLIFLRNAEKILSPLFLEEKLWGYHEMGSHNIRSLIQLLRTNLPQEDGLGNWIQNRRAEGYFLRRP